MFNTLWDQFNNYIKLVTFWELRNTLSKTDILRIALALALNITGSIVKILAPAALAKAVEMIAMSEEAEQFGFLEFTPKELLFISLLLSVWTKAEGYLKDFLMLATEKSIVERHSKKIIKLTHQVSFEDHLELRKDIPGMLMEVMNVQAQLASKTANTVYQVIFDVGIGSAIIWNRFGLMIGSEFLAYCFFDLFVLNNAIDFLTKQNEKFQKANSTLHKFLNREFEILSLEEVVRMFNHQQLEKKLSNKALGKYLNAITRYQLSDKISSGLQLLPFMIANLIPLSFILTENVTISEVDDFIFLFSYLNLFSAHIFNLSKAVKSCIHAIESITTMNQRINSCQRPALRRPITFNLPWLNFKVESPEITFNNVFFTYPNNSEPTLKGLTFKIKSGKTVGIIGRSSAGKSTLIKLLFGLFKPDSGEIKINGYNIYDIPREILCKIFCCVPQNIVLFRGRSIKYNVLYGSAVTHLLEEYLEKKAHKREVSSSERNHYEGIETVESVGLRSSVSQRANKSFSTYMQKVGLDNLSAHDIDKKDGAENLSGGQRQRLSLVRAMMRNSSIFVLDEAFSAQDAFTEREVSNNIRDMTRGRTNIIITHRLTNLEADEIFVLEKGSIKERGSPAVLIEKKGLYYHYLKEQTNFNKRMF